VERDAIHYGTSTGGRIHEEVQVASFRSVYVHLRRAVKPSSLEAIVAIVGLQVPFPRKQKRREHLGAYPVKGIVLLGNAVSSLTAKRTGFVFRTESMI